MEHFYSHGKLLLTGEYVVLDGALALAVPSKYGQSLTIEKGAAGLLKWTSLDENNEIWFSTVFTIHDNELTIGNTSLNELSERLLQIFNAAKQLNPKFLTEDVGYQVSTILEFPKNWGLGTSSTLITNIAQWAKIDPYTLLEFTFGGSGYDIACASATKSLTYHLEHIQNNIQRHINTVDFTPPFMENLYFVFLNQKQNSRDGIKQYRQHTTNVSVEIESINTITQRMIDCPSLSSFQQLINDHEQIISTLIKETPIKKRLFNDFNGSIKSLGAWGGDFVLVASNKNPSSYFKAKGYDIILSYTDMVFEPNKPI